MRIDHLPHPDRLAAEIDIVRARGRTGSDKVRTVELIRTDRRDHATGLIDHCLQRGGLAGIRNDQWRVRRCADRIADMSELVRAAPGHRPFQLLVVAVTRSEVFGYELTCETGRAIDDDVEFRRRVHARIPSCRHCEPTGPREARPDDRLREAIQSLTRDSGLLRRFAPRNDGGVRSNRITSSHKTRSCQRGRRSGYHRARSDSAGRSWPAVSCREWPWQEKTAGG